MEETLRKLDELALELKLLTTEMREKGKLDQRVWLKVYQIEQALNTTAAQGD
jgi:hypothetical protein